MTEQSMIERVGRALAKEEGYTYDPYPYDVRARVAIEAMREPTDAMLSAAEMDDGRGCDIDGYLANKIWRAMVAATDR